MGDVNKKKRIQECW